jgi:ATP-dependent DNA ligase
MKIRKLSLLGIFIAAAHSEAAITTGLVAYFDFESGTTNRAQAVGSDVTGTFVNGTLLDADAGSGAVATAGAAGGRFGKDSGVRCQLLSPIDEAEAQRLLADENWCVQQKFDGRRLMIRKEGSQIIGINRRGLVVSVPEPIAQAALETPFDYLIDGEAVGDVLHVFDLLELDSSDLRARPYLHRVAGLIRWINFGETLRFVKTPIGNDDKKKLFSKLISA